jgi:uncharacterized protein YkwD
MKSNHYAKWFAAALAGVLASCSSSSATDSGMPVYSSVKNDSSLSAKVFTEVNSYRATKGKAALQRHAGLDRLAQKHCDYLVKTAGSYELYGKNVSHIGFEGRALVARQAYNIKNLGENVVSSKSHSAKHLVEAWSRSKSHELNMRSDWYCTGVATAVAPDGSVISTQLFGSAPSLSQMDPNLQRFNR